LCASIGSPATSPIAKIVGSAVRRCRVGFDEALGVDLDLRLVEARRSSRWAGGRIDTST
jgi:hypothetical protein